MTIRIPEYFSQRNAWYGSVPQSVKDEIKTRIANDAALQDAELADITTPKWKSIGPSNVGGRIVDLEMPKGSQSIIYAGAANGGVYKSTDFGTTWKPIFDKQVTLSIGDIEIDPNNDNIIYVGTGEPNTGGGSITYDGNGIYKSTNAGKSWTSIGLTDVGTIGKVSVAKTNSKTIYVAAVGDIFQKSSSRGLYKSTNGGSTWTKVLYISDSTSINDVAISPTDENTVYACAWERISRPQGRVYGGITSNLYVSTNGGTSWTKLLADDPNRGKLTIDIPPTNPSLLYMSMGNKDGTFNSLQKYNGSTFTKLGNANGGTTYTWWFGGIKCDPTSDQIVYYSDFELYKTTNGGTNWNVVAGSSHVDQHAVFIHPSNSQVIVIGNDGGVYTSTNGLGKITSSKIANTQVYDFDVYKADETFVAAAFQDNSFASTSTQMGNWQLFGGGDGVEVRVDPTDKTETYSSQYLGLSMTTSGISGSDRVNWRCPIRLDPVNSKVRYIGTNKLYKFNPSTNKWSALSGDLTNGAVAGNPNFGTLTTIGVAPGNDQYIYTGADDGSVYVTKNGGTSWTKITTGLPAFWTTFITVDPTNPETAYIGFSGYRYGVPGADLYMTTNAGTNWTLISNDLPAVPVNDLAIDPARPGRFYLATDIGVYYTNNSGTNWSLLGVGLPAAVTSTLNYAANSKYLYAATYGRSVYKINLAAFNLPQAPQNTVAALKGSELNSNMSLKLYPNPAVNYIEANFPGNLKDAELVVFNSTGNRMLSQRIEDEASQQTVDVSDLPTGVYVMHLQASGKSYDQRFIVER